MHNLLFLIGRVRSKEKDLLKESDRQRFAEAKDLAAWLRQLNDTVYSEAAGAQTFEEFENKLNRHMLAIKNDLFGNLKYPFEPLLWKKYDLHNIKIFLKIRLGYKDLRKYLVPLGEIPVDVLEAYLIKNEKVNLPVAVMAMLRKAQEIFAKNKDFSKMDTYLDDVYFKELMAEAGKWGEVIEEYFCQQVDQANYKAWWYLKKNERTKLAFIPGGNIKVRFFEISHELSKEQMINKMLPRVQSDNYEEATLQKEFEDQNSTKLFEQRYPNTGILPILIYFRAKEMEIKNLKTYYLLKAKGLKRLTGFLREVYA
ncbi:V-type ATPase subunit [Candidatus Margulisiibacteriota bacterium]